MGHQVDAVKPIVSGYDPAKAAASEPGILLSSLGFPLSPQEIDRISALALSRSALAGPCGPARGPQHRRR
jgi:hypothetical protein